MKLKESEIQELKKSTSELKEGIISIVAILNKHQKGKLYFGIKNNGKVIGQNVTEKSIRNVSQTIFNNIEPKIFPKINEVILNKKKCIKIEFSGKNIPYYAYGRSYMRVGDEDRQLSAKEVEKLIIEKNKEKLRWDNQVCDDAKLSDISSMKLKRFLKKAGLKYISIENSLKKLGLSRRRKLLNTAVMLLGKHPEKFFPNARLRCAVFGKTTATTIDMQDFKGNLFYLTDKAEKYILENIHIGMRLEGLRRVDVPEIDKEAFREAIINAFCHRDYKEFDSVNIAIFKDRLEIRSPGLLYGDLTINRIRNEMVSERRNELIADMFHRVDFIEKWGRGISLILSKEPDTIFKEVGTHFITVFKRKHVGKDVGKDVGKEKRQLIIISKVRNKEKFTYLSLAKELGVNEKTIERDIADLKKRKIIDFKGSPKHGYYVLVPKK